jgi:hypothetical protein
MQNLTDTALRNLESLRKNSYPGRGIATGIDETGQFVIQACWTMGRSADSRNRVYLGAGGEVRTEVADESRLKPDTDLHNIIYPAMLEDGLGMFGVSNGHHTLDLARKNDMNEALANWKYEDDSNHTPRIAGTCYLMDKGSYEITLGSVVKSPFSDKAVRLIYQPEDVGPGFGYCITTYECDGNPLPSFRRVPYLIPLEGDLERVLESLWDALNADNRVSLAVKFINIQTEQSEVRIENKYEYIPRLA